MTAASGADTFGPAGGFGNVGRLSNSANAPASGADQPALADWEIEWAKQQTLRDQLAKAAFDGEPDSLSYEVIDRLLPLIEADRERAKAEAITDLCDDLDHGPLYAEATRYFADRDLDADGLDVARIIRAAALRGSTGGGTT